jgi:hypothetical protein
MRLGRPKTGEIIAGVSACLLFLSMTLDWFGRKSSDGALTLFSVGRTAFEALDYIPVVLLIAIVAAISVVALRLANATHGSLVRADVAVAALGAVSALLILFRIVDPPDFGTLGSGGFGGTILIEGTVKPPMYLALAAAAGIAFGGYWAMREERVSN